MRTGSLICWVMVANSVLCLGRAQSTNGTAEPATNQPASTSVSTNPVAIPLTQIAAQAESVTAALQAVAADSADNKATDAVEQNLPALTSEVSSRLEESSRILSRAPSLDLLRRMESRWQALREQLATWKRTLTKRATQLQRDITRLDQLERNWNLTLGAGKKSSAPPELLRRISDTIGAVHDTRTQVEARQKLVLTLQSRVAEQDARVAQAVAAIDHARQQTVGHLLVRDAAPIWSSRLRSGAPRDLARQGQRSFFRQVKSLRNYASRKEAKFILHGAIFLLIAGFIFWARRKLRQRGETDAGLKHTALVFEVPIATALILALLASSWIYPQAPRLLWAILGAAALIPSAIVLRRLIRPGLFPVVWALVAFYLVDQLRSVTAAPELLSRGLFLAEMLAAAVFAAWFLGSRKCRSESVTRWERVMRAAVKIALALFAAAFISNVCGYASLAKLLGNATLTSSYLGLILYAVIRIADSLVLSALTVRPLAHLEMARRHRAFIQARVRQLFEMAAGCVWAIYTLEAFSLRAPVFQDIKQIMVAKLSVGSATFTFGDVLLFCVTIWGAFVISRIFRFVLEEEVYPHVRLAPGVHYSISRMVHYAILLAGFFIAIALLGFNLTRLTILVGAVGVGLGFGLQNIINNFVSGLILLFERPVKVGDVIQLDSTEGIITQIGIRASVVRTTSGPEIIVPNGKLISDPVTNWTFSRRQRLITIPLAVAAGVDARRIMEILQSAAAGQKLLLRDPPVQALMIEFKAGALHFELRAWTDEIRHWMQIRSDLSAEINAALIKENITLK